MACILAVFAGSLAPVAVQAQTTLYWGGGTTNRVSGSSPLNPATGTWDTVTANWGDAATGIPATYSAWNSAVGNTASLGARALSQLLTIPAATSIAVGGLTTYKFESTNSYGALTIAGNLGSLTISNGATLNITTGTTVNLSISNIISSTFTVTGGGTLGISAPVSFTSLPGTVTVANATLSLNNIDPYHWLFANAALNLSNGVYNMYRNNDWVPDPWQAITGSGTIQSTYSTQGLYPICLNNAADTTFSAQLLNGTYAGVEAVLYKSGAGKLTVMNSSNAYFGNFVRQGLLTPGAAGAISGWVLVDGSSSGTGIFGTSDSNFFAGGSVTAGSGGQINGANLGLSQYQLMAGGAVQYNALGEVPGTGRVLNGAQPGSVIAGGYAFNSNFLQRIQESFDGVIALGANIGSGTTLDFNSAAGGNFAKARLGAWGGVRTFDGTLVPNGGNYRLGGGNSILTLSAALTGSGSLDVSDAQNKGYFGQTSFAPNGVILTANNTLSGPVTIGHGVTLSLSNANGRLSGATGITITGGGTLTGAGAVTVGGTLALVDSASGSQADRIPSVEVAIRNGGTFRYTGTGGAIESAGVLTIDGGCSMISSARGTGSGNAVVQFASLNPTNWGTAQFLAGGNSQIGFVTAPATNGGMLGPWAVVAGSGSPVFAVYQTNGSGSVIAMPASAMTNVASATVWQNCSSNANVQVTGAFTAGTNATIGSMCFNNSGYAITWVGTNMVTTGGIAAQGSTSANTAFSGGQWTSGTADHGLYLYCFDYYNSGKILSFGSDIIDNGASPVTVVSGGNGTVALSSGNNTFSGGVVINSGTLRTTMANGLGTGSSLVLNGFGAILDINGSDARTLNQTITVNADATILGITGGSGSTTLNGGIALNNNSLLSLGAYNLSRPITLNGAVGGSGSLRLRGLSTTPIALQGSAGNTYTGDTFVAAQVVLNKSTGNAIPGNVYLGTIESVNPTDQRPMLLLAQNNQIADTAVVTFGGGVAGTNTYNLSPVLRFSGKSDEIAGLNSLLGNGIVENGSNTTVSTLTLSGSGAYSFGGLIWNGTGTGTQALVKAGSGTQTLAGASLYVGGTTVTGGCLLVRNTSGSGTGTGSVTVAVNGTLGGDGRIVPGTNRTISVSGTMAPGVGVSGALTIDFGSGASNLTFNSGASLAYALGAPGSSGALTLLNVKSGKLVLNSNVVNLSNAGGLAPGQYTLMTFYSDNGATLTDTGKPTSGLVVNPAFSPLAGKLDYAQTGKIVLRVTSGGTALLFR